MSSTSADTELTRSAPVDLWRRTLAQIPSAFGRLVYLSSLRDASGRYTHHGLAHLFGEAEADEALKRSHEAVFDDWLTLFLPQQKQDVEVYLEGLGTQPAQVIASWMRTEIYRTLAPSSARASQRRLFESDFRVLTELFRRQFGLSSPDPEN